MPPPETPASDFADAEGRVRIFYRVRDAQGNEFVGSTFIIAHPQDTVETLALESEEFAYAVAVESSGTSGSPDIVEVVDTTIIPAMTEI